MTISSREVELSRLSCRSRCCCDPRLPRVALPHVRCVDVARIPVPLLPEGPPMTDLPLYPPAPSAVPVMDQAKRCDGPGCDGIPCAMVTIGPDVPTCLSLPTGPDGFVRLNLCPDCTTPFVGRTGILVAGVPVPASLRWYA